MTDMLMKDYLRNLALALMGRNPYQAERDDLAEKLEKADENVRVLKHLYCNVLEKWESKQKQAASLQQLVENLRERIKDKDAAIDRYIIDMNALRGELQLARKKEIPF